jgi:hypothetical protein
MVRFVFSDSAQARAMRADSSRSSAANKVAEAAHVDGGVFIVLTPKVHHGGPVGPRHVLLADKDAVVVVPAGRLDHHLVPTNPTSAGVRGVSHASMQISVVQSMNSANQPPSLPSSNVSLGYSWVFAVRSSSPQLLLVGYFQTHDITVRSNGRLLMKTHTHIISFHYL